MDDVGIRDGPVRTAPTATSPQELTHTARVLAGTSFSEAAVACGGAVLAILGLVGVAPSYMATIGTIAIGASLLVEGAGHAALISQLRGLAQRRLQTATIGSGLSAEVAGGLAGVVLGVLALLGIAPNILMGAASIVFGATLLFSGAAEAEVESLIATAAEGGIGGAEYATVQLANSANALVGIGAVALGVLVLASVGPQLTLILVALLAAGASLTLSGSALGSDMGLVARRR